MVKGVENRRDSEWTGPSGGTTFESQLDFWKVFFSCSSLPNGTDLQLGCVPEVDVVKYVNREVDILNNIGVKRLPLRFEVRPFKDLVHKYRLLFLIMNKSYIHGPYQYLVNIHYWYQKLCRGFPFHDKNCRGDIFTFMAPSFFY